MRRKKDSRLARNFACSAACCATRILAETVSSYSYPLAHVPPAYPVEYANFARPLGVAPFVSFFAVVYFRRFSNVMAEKRDGLTESLNFQLYGAASRCSASFSWQLASPIPN